MDPYPAAAGASYPPGGTSQKRKQEYERLRGQLDLERSSFISHWKELNDYIMPRRGRFLITDRNKGEKRSKNIIDGTATQGARTLSSGMMSGITSPARPWFRLTTPDPDLAEFASVKDWLHTVTQRMQTVMLRSNFYKIRPLVYNDLGVFGTAATMIEEDPKFVIRCTSFPVGSYYLANDANGDVCVFIREFGMTVRQVVDRFTDGKDLSNLTAATRERWNRKETETWIDIVHIVKPNEDYDATKLESRFKPFTDCYYEKGQPDNVFLRESGFDEFPVMAPKWSVTGEDSYGTDSPGMTALGDIKQLQLGEKKIMQAIEKLVNPPMIAPPSMRNFKLSLLPGDVSYQTESQYQTFRPVHEVRPDVDKLEYKQAQTRQRISRAFYEDLFLMLAYTDPTRGKQPVTAAEIAERHDEKLLALGPVLQNQEQDDLKPSIDRIFAIMVRAGHIPEAPRELEGVPLKVEYISIMAQAQKMIGLSGLERFSGFVGSLAAAQAAAPHSPAWDKFDVDQAIDEHAEMMGVPPRIVVPDDDVAQIRAARAKQAQIAQSAQLAASAAQTGKTLSETDTQGRNALTDVMAGAA